MENIVFPLAFLIYIKTLISNYCCMDIGINCTFALWFFHNSIRFKVNKIG